MAEYQRIRREVILREAEGYLDLLMGFPAAWSLSSEVRDRLAQRALAALATLDKTAGRRADALHLTGQLLRVMERYREAIVPLQQAAEFDPENIHIWLALGWCQKRNGRLDLAIQSLEEALAADGSQAIIYYNLACYWSLAGNAKLCVAYLSRALDLDPNYRDLISDESDFDPIRDHPHFQALTSVAA